MYHGITTSTRRLCFANKSKSISMYLILILPDARSCTTCDRVLQELEQIDDDTDSFGVDFVKINDKRLAKHYGITKFPALTYFREKKPIIYEGNNNVCEVIVQTVINVLAVCGLFASIMHTHVPIVVLHGYRFFRLIHRCFEITAFH